MSKCYVNKVIVIRANTNWHDIFIPLRTKQSLIFCKGTSVTLNSQIRIITMLVFVKTGNLRIPVWDQLQWHGVHNGFQ